MADEIGSKSSNSRYRVVLDTSVLISGIFFGNGIDKLIANIASRHQLILSEYILDEFMAFTDKIVPRISRKTKMAIYYTLENFVYKYESGDVDEALRDRADADIILLAEQYKAIVVSSDKDLLEYESTDSPLIVSVGEFSEYFL